MSSFSRRMLWEMMPKFLLKSIEETSTAFPSPTECVILSYKGVCQAEPAFHEAILSGPDALVALYMPGNGTQDDLLRDLQWH